MSKGKSNGFDWQKRLSDRKKSLSAMNKKIGQTLKEAERRKALEEEEKKHENEIKATLSQFEIMRDSDYLKIDNMMVSEYGKTKYIADNYHSLSKLLLEAKAVPGIYFILSWPCSLDWLVVSQFLANEHLLRASTYSDGLKLGIYPSRTTAFGRLKKFRINRQNLIEEAQDVVNSGLCENDRVMAYLSLQEFSRIDSPSEREHPSLKDLTPGFYFHGKEGWVLYGGGYLSDIYTYMFNASGNRRRGTIHKVSDSLNDHLTTTEGVFLVPPGTPSRDLMKIFKLDESIDAIALDAKEKNIEYGNISKEEAANIFHSWFDEGNNCSLLVLFDNPFVMNSFRREVFMAYKKAKVSLKTNNWFKQYAFLQHEDKPMQDELFTNSNTRKVKEGHSSPKIHILGLGHISLFKSLINIALDVDRLEPKLAKEMKRAIGFLLRISYLPISQAGLLKWIKSISGDWSEDDVISLSRKYLWSSYFRAWKQRVSDFDTVLSTSHFEAECEKIAGLIQDATETEDKVLQIATDCLDNPDQKTLIVTVERKTVDFINEIVADYGCKELSGKIDVCQISKDLNLDGYDQVAVFGLNDRKLKDILSLFSDDKNRNEIYINAYSSLKIHYELQSLRNIEAFARLYEWIDGLKSQIEPVLSSLEGLHNLYSDSTNEISNPYDNQNYDHDGEKYASIHLSGYGAIEVAQHSTIIRRSHSELSEWEATTVADLLESERVVVIDDSFVESVGETIHAVGGTNEEEGEILKSYFLLAQGFIKSKYNQKKRKSRASAIYAEMSAIDSSMASQVTLNMVERWVKNIEEFNSDESQIASRSARKQSHYLLFAKAINLDESIATIFWQKGIKQFRSNNIQEGRRLANHIRYLLVGMLDHRLLGISDDEYEKIKNIARDKEFSVEMITFMKS